MSDSISEYLNKVSFSIDKIIDSLSISLNGKKLCVCFSGGVDSVSLLVSLNMLKSRYGFELNAAHVNHLLRGKEADRDENFCANLCEKLGIKLYLVQIDINKLSKENKKSIEETARDARYSYFSSLGKQNKIDYFATAHTKNDNAETVYMNIIRGTTVSGICGIPQINGNIIRPILNISREENVAFVSNSGYTFVTDSTNNDNAYTRNYIRNILLPDAKKVNSRAIEAVYRLSAYAKSDENYFTSVLNNMSANIKDTELHPSLLRRKLQRDYAFITGGKGLLTVHIDSLIKLLSLKKNKSLSMPGGIMAIVKDGKVSFVFKEKIKKITDNSIYELKYGKNIFADGLASIFLLENNIINNCINSKNIYNNYTCTKLSFDNISGSVKYRARHTGDKIFCLGVNKSIKKEFIEKGIPVYLREVIPIFFDDIGIVYVPFIGAADRVYQRDDNVSDENLVTISVTIKTDVPITKGRI